MLKTPVVLTLFNRPEIASRVFSEVAKARPSRLYLIADAPRPDRPGEAEKCAEARGIVDRVDWDCEVIKDFAEVNLGPRERLSSGINRVFELEETAIILEHDCLPHPTFFRYCDELLEKYRDDERVMHIGGVNFLFGRVHTPGSYFFSRITQPWGFATWRRAWKNYDVKMKAWPEVRDTALLQDALLNDKVCADHFKEVFDGTYDGTINTWDFQWLLTFWRLNGLAVYPKVNLISNIGFGDGALNCGDNYDQLANIPMRPMRFPLRHQSQVERHVAADRFVIEHILVPNRRLQTKHFRKWVRQVRKKLALGTRFRKLVGARVVLSKSQES